jgi:hypothetical protein
MTPLLKLLDGPAKAGHYVCGLAAAFAKGFGAPGKAGHYD